MTGGAGFIGSHVCRALLARGDHVVVLDNLDPFYEVAVKRRHLDELASQGGDRFSFVEGDLRESESCKTVTKGVTGMVHLAALAGVRPSIAEPARYMDVNVTGTQVLLRAA